jgi:hypothetical protein
MIPAVLIDRVVAEVREHCRQSKGYEEGSHVNPPVPVDCMSAFAMARLLIERLRLVTKALLEHQPRSLSLCLERLKEDQLLDNVCSDIETVYQAEDHLDPGQREEYEAAFIRFFDRAATFAWAIRRVAWLS